MSSFFFKIGLRLIEINWKTTLTGILGGSLDMTWISGRGIGAELRWSWVAIDAESMRNQSGIKVELLDSMIICSLLRNIEVSFCSGNEVCVLLKANWTLLLLLLLL